MSAPKNVDLEANIAELLEIDALLAAAGFPSVSAKTLAHVTRQDLPALISVVTVRFMRAFEDAIRAGERVSQRCAVCQAESALCAACAADREALYRVGAPVIFLCRAVAARAHQCFGDAEKRSKS
jgi:hypothetical protein